MTAPRRSYRTAHEGFQTSCINCNRESHFLGVFCWWGVFMLIPLVLVGAATIVFMVYMAATAP